jgi:methionyl-tRNA synthetase
MEGIIEFNEWQKLDLRTAQIKKVEDIPGADKLYKLTLNVGSEIGERTICAGIKEFYSKEELKNKKIVFFVNLKPRLMRGIESKGMLLAAVSHDNSGEETKVVLISPEKDIENGERIS